LLKHRLTGAIILIAIAVVFVPELLSGRNTLAPTAEPTLVEQGSGVPIRSYEIDLTDPTSPPQRQPPELTTPATTPVATPVATPPAEQSVATPPAAPVVATPPPSTPSVAAPSVAATSAVRGGYVVQLGSFSSRAGAERLAGEVRRRGFDVRVTEVRVGSRELHRVRVGATAPKDAADALASRLRALGHTGRVVSDP